jgi:hypothetical protein
MVGKHALATQSPHWHRRGHTPPARIAHKRANARTWRWRAHTTHYTHLGLDLLTLALAHKVQGTLAHTPHPTQQAESQFNIGTHMSLVFRKELAVFQLRVRARARVCGFPCVCVCVCVSQ